MKAKVVGKKNKAKAVIRLDISTEFISLLRALPAHQRRVHGAQAPTVNQISLEECSRDIGKGTEPSKEE